jgi:nicotinate-nucleotide adenylyltransferase
MLFVPNRVSPFKAAQGVTTPAHRLRMTKLAAESNPAFVCSALEIEREGASYTVDTLQILHTQHPEARLFFLCGVDTVADVMSWREPDTIFGLTEFIAVTRPHFAPEVFHQTVPPLYHPRIHLMEGIELGISSSDIRERLRKGLPIRYLTPDVVVEYIEKQGLYRNDPPVQPRDSSR